LTHSHPLADADRLAIETLNEHTLSGLAVGVVSDGELVYARGFGIAEAPGRAVTPDTVFRIGSISKTFTAVAVMQLVEEGRLRLDDPVNDHLRAYRVGHPDASAPPVTARHLLTHTAGLGELRRPTDLLRPTIGLAAKRGKPLPSLAEYYAPTLRAEVRPGTKWAYANHGFATLGQLVEDVAGRPFAEHMLERVFEPLGMRHTDFLRSERVRGELAVGYALKRGRLRAAKDTEIVVAPAGSVFSSVRDMALYVAALTGGWANEHGRILRPETLQEMLTPQSPADDRLPSMGLSFFLDRFGGHRVAGHDGGWPGFISSLLIAPDHGLGVVAFTNTSVAIAPHTLGGELLRRLLGVPPEERELPRPNVPEQPHVWPELTGLYKPLPGLNTNFRWWPLLGGEVEVVVRDGHLAVRALSPARPLRKGLRLYPLDASDPHLFAVRHRDFQAPVLFRRGAGGDVNSVVAGAGEGGFLELYRRPRASSLRLWGRAGAAAGAVALVRAGRRARAR